MYLRAIPRVATACALAMCLAVAAGCGSSNSSDNSAGSTGGTPSKPTTLTVGIIPVSNLAPLFVGIDQGFFRDEGLTIKTTMSEGGAEVVPKVLSNEVQIGYSNIPSLMVAAGKGLPLQIVADPGGGEAEGANAKDSEIIAQVVVGKNSSIRSAKDLAGKTIAVNTLNNVADVTTKASLAKQGVDPNSVKFLELPFPDMPAALAAGRVDAAFLVSPFLQQARADGARTILRPYYDVHPGFVNTAYFASSKWADGHEAEVAAFQRAVNRSVAYSAEHPEAIRAALPKFTKIPASMVATIPLGGVDAALDEPTLQEILDLMKRYGGLTKAPDLKTFVHKGALREGGGA
jgi:NitT/TauT family transport system substrate-binding protein